MRRLRLLRRGRLRLFRMQHLLMLLLLLLIAAWLLLLLLLLLIVRRRVGSSIESMVAGVGRINRVRQPDVSLREH